MDGGATRATLLIESVSPKSRFASAILAPFWLERDFGVLSKQLEEDAGSQTVVQTGTQRRNPYLILRFWHFTQSFWPVSRINSTRISSMCFAAHLEDVRTLLFSAGKARSFFAALLWQPCPTAALCWRCCHYSDRCPDHRATSTPRSPLASYLLDPSLGLRCCPCRRSSSWANAGKCWSDQQGNNAVRRSYIW